MEDRDPEDEFLTPTGGQAARRRLSSKQQDSDPPVPVVTESGKRGQKALRATTGDTGGSDDNSDGEHPLKKLKICAAKSSSWKPTPKKAASVSADAVYTSYKPVVKK